MKATSPDKRSPSKNLKGKSPRKSPKKKQHHSPLREEPQILKKKVPNEVSKFSYLYSPRTTFSNNKQAENLLFQDLSVGFDPVTIKIIKKHFKEKLGSLDKFDFVSKLKNHLLTWHPEIPNREEVLIKLLTKLFGEIDLNNNGNMEWDEFTNYIIHSSNNTQRDSIAYKMKCFANSRATIDDSEFTEMVSYAFYIDKFNLIGLVQDGKSNIIFYDGNTCKKVKAGIDVRDTQKAIDEIAVRELDQRAEENVKKEKNEKRMKRLRQSQKKKNSVLVTETSNTRSDKKENKRYGRFNTLGDNSDNEKKNDEETPPKLKKELEKLRHENYPNIQKFGNKKLTVLATVFVPEYDTLLVSSSNNKISAWKYSSGEFKNVNKIAEVKIDKLNFSCAIQTTNVPQYTLSWEPVQKNLYSGQADGKILKWELTRTTNIETDILDFTKAKAKHDQELKANGEYQIKKTKTVEDIILINDGITHKNYENNEYLRRDSVSSIVVLGKLQILAAGYYNGNVILWDTMLKDYRKFYTDQETGIYQLAYDPNKNLLFSCGFDHNIYIYDPYIDTSAVYKLIGHNTSINSIAVNPQENTLVSIDILGNIKIWDLNNYYNYQTIQLNSAYDRREIIEIQNAKKKKISSNLKMICLPKINKILTYGDKLVVFETDTCQNPELCDDQIILGSYYNPYSYEIISICLRKIKLWNVFNGKVKTIYEDLMNAETTAYCVDKAQKRIYLGDSNGKIKNFNMSNSSIIKEFTSHQKEISQLLYSQNMQILISLSTDQQLKIHNDYELLQNQIIKELDMTQMNIISMHLYDEFYRLCLGLSSGNVKFYDIEHYRFDSEIEIPGERQFHNDEVVLITAIKPIPVIFISHTSGKTRFMLIPPSPYRQQFFLQRKNKPAKQDCYISSCIISACYDENGHRLFTGDQLGIVKCVDCSEMVKLFNEKDQAEIVSNLDSIPEPKLLYQIQAHRELIKNISFPDMRPSVFITTSNDRKVKIFNAIDGEFIDELKQISSKEKDTPIGLQFDYADPFQSKRDADTPLPTGVITRKDIINFHPISEAKVKKMYATLPVTEYMKKVTELSAKEKFYNIIKKCELPLDKSNKWRLEIDLEYIQNSEESLFNQIIQEIKRKEVFVAKSEKLMKNVPLSSDNYHPFFIDEMNEEQIKEFNEMLSRKLRHAKMSLSKVRAEKKKYEEFEKEKEREKNISIKQALELVGDLKLGTNKNLLLPPVKQKNTKKTTNDKFQLYKEDFDSKINDLENIIEKKLKSRIKLLPKIQRSTPFLNLKTEPI